MNKNNSLIPKEKNSDDSRVLPLFIAGLVCFSIATFLGVSAWYLFGSASKYRTDSINLTTNFNPNQTNSNSTVSSNSETNPENSDPTSTVETSKRFKGTVEVEGTNFSIGGDDPNRPSETVNLEDFLISETEVTNSQYAEFVKETDYNPPQNWKNGTFPEGLENYPVVNVSWEDARNYCEWLGKQYEAEVRLPTEAEWELAAGGLKKFKYPWGNEWIDKAVANKTSDGILKEVKSNEINKSPVGAFDMVGNVWEWTAEKISLDEVNGKAAKKALEKGKQLRIAKGGSFEELPVKLTVAARAEIPKTTKFKSLGFRYVIILGKSISNSGE